MSPSLANRVAPGSKKPPIEQYRERIAEGVLEVDPAQRKLVERLEALYRQILHRHGWLYRHFSRAPKRSAGLYIWGDVGRGKSMLMDLFYSALPEGWKERVHFHAFMQGVHRELHQLRQTSPGDDPLIMVADRVAERFRILCFDEFQVSDIADAMILSRLFERLFDRGLTVVFTSNRAPDQLYLNGLQRESFLPFIALLRDRIEVVELSSREDYRLSKLAALESVYQTPLGPAADRFVEQVWHDLACDGEGASREIEVLGRQLRIPMTCRDIARFRFADLCEMPLSAGDYLALTAQFRTFFVTDIPKMSRERRDAAKRFVTLIDVLYENHAKLIATAAVPPAELYPSGDGSFEFHRTVSRLIEMQSAAYLATSQHGPGSLS